MKKLEQMTRRGWLALIGGGEDKGRDLAVLRQIVAINGSRHVAIIPSASRVGDEVGSEYDRVFRNLAVEKRDILKIRHRDEADHPDHLAAIDAADLIFFTGGDQVRLVEILAGTALIASVARRLQDGATVAGTSAGAAAAGQRMLFDGDGRGFTKGAIGTAAGFGFIGDIAFDTHFVSRGRIGRLTQFLASGEASQGFGLSEDTALLISPDDIASVIGSDMVTALKYPGGGHNDYHAVAERQLFSVDGVRLSFLAPGSDFDLLEWRSVPRKKATLHSLKLAKNAPALA